LSNRTHDAQSDVKPEAWTALVDNLAGEMPANIMQATKFEL
jgi:hypothetical protein